MPRKPEIAARELGQESANVFLGSIEPHALMLNQPDDGQLLYKVMTVENLLRSIQGSYLHFNRVDSYSDFSGADPNDGEQLPTDRSGNSTTKFEKAPHFSASDYYDQSRARTYAACFSMENSDSIWKTYGKRGEHGNVCVAFEFAKLRAMLNDTLKSKRLSLLYRDVRCYDVFSINYGVVEYVDWAQHQANSPHSPNPLTYTYLKDANFAAEKELRISLSALGMGQFVIGDGIAIEFPSSLTMAFDFHRAYTVGAIRKILSAPGREVNFLDDALLKLVIQS